MMLSEHPPNNQYYSGGASRFAKPGDNNSNGERVPQPSRRPPATAFQPVQQQQHHQQQPGSPNSFMPQQQQQHNSNHHHQHQQHHQPALATHDFDSAALPSSDISVQEIVATLDQLVQTLSGQATSIMQVRDALLAELAAGSNNNNNNGADSVMVTRRVNTLVSQIKPLFVEAEEIMARLRREDVKVCMPPPSAVQNNNNNNGNSLSLRSEEANKVAPSRRQPAIPAPVSTGNGSSSPSVAAASVGLPVPASFSRSKYSDEREEEAAFEHFQAQVQQQQQQQQQQPPAPRGGSAAAPGSSFQLIARGGAEGIALPGRGGNKRYVRASQVYVQRDDQDGPVPSFGSQALQQQQPQQQRMMTQDGGTWGMAPDNNNHQQQQHCSDSGAAPGFSARAASAAVPDHLRRQPRNTPHHFCVVEFKCHRMKRYPCDEELMPGNYVICWGDKGEDCGLVVLTGTLDDTHNFQNVSVFQDMHVELNRVRNISDVYILRTASAEEVHTLHNELASYEESALAKCQEMAIQRGLQMRVTDCEIQFDRQKFTFYFDAPESIDFRDLTRELHRLFRARIWLENINANVKNIVPEGALSQADKKIFAARGVRMSYR